MNWWRHVMAMEIRKILAYRSDFWIIFLGQTAVQLVIATALWKSIFETQGTIQMNGFTLPMMTLYYLIVPIGMRMLTGENIGFISREIYDGSFNRYLIYPLSVFQYKAVTYLTYSLFYGVQLILLFSIYQFTMIDVTPTLMTFVHLFEGVALFLISATTYVLMAMLIELLALWADNIWTLVVMLRFFTSFFGGGFIPLAFFPLWAREILVFTPFPYLVSLPVRTVMGQSSSIEITLGIVVLLCWSFFFMGCVALMWNKGQKNYSGVGI